MKRILPLSYGAQAPRKIGYHRSGVRVRFDLEFLKKEDERREEKKKLLKVADERKKDRCRQLFGRLTDTRNRADLGVALQGVPFRTLLVGLMDQMNIPANNNLTNRLYSMAIQQAGDFDNLYDNDGDFRALIELLQELVLKNGGPFTGLVTPDNTPGRDGGNGGNADGAPPVAV